MLNEGIVNLVEIYIIMGRLWMMITTLWVHVCNMIYRSPMQNAKMSFVHTYTNSMFLTMGFISVIKWYLSCLDSFQLFFYSFVTVHRESQVYVTILLNTFYASIGDPLAIYENIPCFCQHYLVGNYNPSNERQLGWTP